jgi:nucleoside phosphorylase
MLKQHLHGTDCDGTYNKRRKALMVHVPAIHAGTVASGSDVVKSDKKNKNSRLSTERLGVEMQGCGVMHAAFFHREPLTGAS